MSVIRFIMMERNESRSGLIPSRSIPAIFWAISEGADGGKKFWKKVAEIDPGLQIHFSTNEDSSPLLEGIGDGLLVVSWEHRCIESFQEYQPITYSGMAVKHNGVFSEDTKVEFRLNREWHLIDHFFEEKN